MLLSQVFMCKNYKIQAIPGSPLISFSDMLRIYFLVISSVLWVLKRTIFQNGPLLPAARPSEIGPIHDDFLFAILLVF